jgi:phosphatidylinositol 3-kinase
LVKAEHKILLKKHKDYLFDKPGTLGKFLKIFNWNSSEECEGLESLLKKWKNVSFYEALELLGPSFRFPKIREFAVQVLSAASDEDMHLNLLQLVQAIKFESAYPSPLSKLLVFRCSQNLKLAHFFYWYVKVEIESEISGPWFSSLSRDLLGILVSNPKSFEWPKHIQDNQNLLFKMLLELFNILKTCKSTNGMKRKMNELLKSSFMDLQKISIRNPVKPHILLKGIVPEKCTVFASAKTPLKIAFRNAENNNVHNFIFKSGDDLRQDQLILQIILLMDVIMKRENMDMRLSPYQVLSMSPRDGYLELVENSHNISKILQSHGKRPIYNFLIKQSLNPEIQEKIFTNYIKSCAGYCVITFLLGIGDRHLDNILIRENGQLFHIDFGYIFGMDPKPLQPKIRIIPEMIDAMGGVHSPQYYQFLSDCNLAYRILRKNSSIFFILLELMSKSGIPVLEQDFEGTMDRFQERFRLDSNDEQAQEYLNHEIIDSMGAYTPIVAELLHKMAVRMRSANLLGSYFIQ